MGATLSFRVTKFLFEMTPNPLRLSISWLFKVNMKYKTKIYFFIPCFYKHNTDNLLLNWFDILTYKFLILKTYCQTLKFLSDSQLCTWRKIPWRFQLNPYSHLGGVVVKRFLILMTYWLTYGLTLKIFVRCATRQLEDFSLIHPAV